MAGSRAGAETSVGLDARGVDPMAAVNNPLGLDVRDELGRSVSGRAVLDDLKKAQVARAAETAYASTLPGAKTVLPILEAAVGRALSLFQLAEAPPGPTAWASLPTPRPRPILPCVVVLGAVFLQVAAASRPRASLPALSSCRRCFEVLRC